MAEAWRPQIDDDGTLEAHPLVATRALLTGRARSLPSARGVRAATGRLGRSALDAHMAIAEALFSVGGEAPPAERLAWLRGEHADFLARSSRQTRLLFALAGHVVSIAAPLLIGKLPRLQRLSIEQRVRALTRLEGSAAAPLLIAVRALLCLHYYEHPDAAAEAGMGVSGPGSPVGVQAAAEERSDPAGSGGPGRARGPTTQEPT